MSNNRNLPDVNQISLLSAVILLTYILIGLIILPASNPINQRPGTIPGLSIDPKFFLGLIIAGITAAGTNWVVRSHPKFQDRFSIQHWLVPSLTAWIIGLILFQLPEGSVWWSVLLFGLLIILIIIISEYLTVDPDGLYHATSTIILTALSYALFLTLSIILRGINARNLVLIPTISIASGLTSLRTLHLQLKKWYLIHAVVIAIVVAEFSAPLFYFSFDSTVFGLVLLGPAYGLTSLSSGLLTGKSLGQSLIEPIIVLVIVWGIALII